MMRTVSVTARRLLMANRPVLQQFTAVRGYRGDSGDGETNLSAAEEALVRKGKPVDEAIRARHVRPVQLKELSPQNLADLQANASGSGTSTQDLELEIRRKRLIYRAKQRGWLEVDILLGAWASENVPQLEGDELDQFEDFCNEETIDIYNIITLRLDVPDHMKRPDGQGVVERIQEWARSSPLGKADPSTYKKVKESAKLI
ncbi:Flavinator of succinate dehydrogenase [Seminavis robusta]|uniref:Flavinator of succinate dehydrogenase n=1 Tax=Seminavis robusta TaxID=568900 RepID=A0A9N8HYL7_9STRA|nr:Flavinator of succinate dehydrogenase [Seminavis robusta]|eukprot:Sro2939_g340650.1 Flavinator of succinate dehydrogenase (202) ;mRNA; f:6017-6622